MHESVLVPACHHETLRRSIMNLPCKTKEPKPQSLGERSLTQAPPNLSALIWNVISAAARSLALPPALGPHRGNRQAASNPHGLTGLSHTHLPLQSRPLLCWLNIHVLQSLCHSTICLIGLDQSDLKKKIAHCLGGNKRHGWLKSFGEQKWLSIRNTSAWSGLVNSRVSPFGAVFPRDFYWAGPVNQPCMGTRVLTQGEHLKHAGQCVLRSRAGEHCFKGLYNIQHLHLLLSIRTTWKGISSTTGSHIAVDEF